VGQDCETDGRVEVAVTGPGGLPAFVDEQLERCSVERPVDDAMDVMVDQQRLKCRLH
jgi:hypothetical protein